MIKLPFDTQASAYNGDALWGPLFSFFHLGGREVGHFLIGYLSSCARREESRSGEDCFYTDCFRRLLSSPSVTFISLILVCVEFD